MGLIFTHESGIEGAYAKISQINMTKDRQSVYLDIYASKAARLAGKPPVASIAAEGVHDIATPGNAWAKGYGVAKQNDKLKDAQDDL